MAYKSSYTGEKMDEILAKSKNFTKNDESWTVLSPSITTLDVSNVMKPGNYIYSGNLFIPEMDPLYGYTKTTKDSMTLTGNYIIFVRRINYNIYQYISAHGIYENNDDMIVIAWIRQSDYTYTPKFYYNNEPSNSMMGFATSESSDKCTHKYPNQMRKFDNDAALKYFDAATQTYVSFVEGGAMSSTVYGNVENVFSLIDSTVPTPIDYASHMNNETIHVTTAEKTSYANKMTEEKATDMLDAWESDFLVNLNEQIQVVKDQITTVNSMISPIQSSLDTHKTDTTKHPTNTQIANWDSKSDKDHTHTIDQITISATDVIGVLDPSNISDDAKEKQVTVTDKSALLALTNSDVHNGCWVLQKSATSNVITYYVVVDDTKLGTDAAFQQLSTTPYSSTDLVWSNISGSPTTIDELGLAVSNDSIDQKVSNANNLATTANNSVNAVIDKAEPLMMQDNSFAMENLIDLIDYKMQLISTLLNQS